MIAEETPGIAIFPPREDCAGPKYSAILSSGERADKPLVKNINHSLSETERLF